MKRLREQHTREITDPDLKKEMAISFMVTGEYGEQTKRPHWHAILFNYSPPDLTYSHTTERGDKIYTSKIIEELWGFNDSEKVPNEIGSVTIDSAGYVARYAAKKLVHGEDQEHDYHPIHKVSLKNAIGRRYVEKNYETIFRRGFVYLPNGQKTKIPRYYVDWLKKHKPEAYVRYVTELRLHLQKEAEKKNREKEIRFFTELANAPVGFSMPITESKMQLTILKQKFKKLQEKLKL